MGIVDGEIQGTGVGSQLDRRGDEGHNSPCDLEREQRAKTGEEGEGLLLMASIFLYLFKVGRNLIFGGWASLNQRRHRRMIGLESLEQLSSRKVVIPGMRLIQPVP